MNLLTQNRNGYPKFAKLDFPIRQVNLALDPKLLVLSFCYSFFRDFVTVLNLAACWTTCSPRKAATWSRDEIGFPSQVTRGSECTKNFTV
jgi:hypothetical protein